MWAEQLAPLVGREGESAVVDQIVARVGRREPSLLVIEGEAGIGKTSLVRHLVAGETRRGTTVLAGACSPGAARDLPFHGWAGVTRTLGEGARVFGQGPARSRGQVLAAVTEDLLGRARAERLTVVVEDVHWADDSTLDLLDYLVRAARGERLLVAITVRSADPAYDRIRDRVRELVSLPHAVLLRPRRLSPEEVAAQIELLSGSPPDEDTTRRTFQRTDGVPFLVEEVTAAGGVLDAQDVVGHRLGVLAEDARVVADAAAVAGERVDDNLLFHACGLNEDRFDAAVTETVSAGVLQTGSDPGLRFRHALLREACAQALPPRRRRQLHRQWAQAITNAQPAGTTMAAELAEHWLAAGDDEQALPTLLRAAAAAEHVFAYRERLNLLLTAAETWLRVSDATERTGTDLATVLADAAELAHMLADFDVAHSLVDQGRRLLAGCDDGPRRAWFDLIDLWMRLDERRGGTVAEMRKVVRALRQQPPNRQVARGLFALHGSLLQDGRAEESERVLDQAWPLVESLDDDAVRVTAFSLRAHVLAATGRYREALRWCEKTQELAERLGGLLLRGEALVTLSVVLWESGDLAGAVVAADRGKQLLGGSKPGPLPQLWALHACNAIGGLMDLARWDEAEQRLQELDAAKDLLATYSLDYATWLRWFLDSARGEPVPVERFCEPDEEVAGQQIQNASSDVTWSVEMLTQLGDLEQARRVAAPLLSQDRLRTAIPAFVWDFLAIVSRNEAEATLAGLGDREAAARLATLSAQLPTPNPLLETYAAQVAADLATSAGAGSHQQYQDVAQRWEQIGYRHWQAWALLHAGRAAADNGDQPTARAAFARAASIATDLRANPLHERVRQAASRHGIRLHVEPSRLRADSAGLTARELQVLDLLHEGASNRDIAEQLFISQKTASVHVSNLIAKLHAANRGGAVAAARRRGLLDFPEPQDG